LVKNDAFKGKHRFSIFAVGLMLLFPAGLFAAERLTVGVAANFILPFKALAQTFGRKHSIPVEATFTSSGNLYGQIINGAPYDLFLSADRERPEKLFQNRLAEKPFVYARGKIVLWGLNKDLYSTDKWEKALMLPSLKKISIANPDTTPYGFATMKALQTIGQWPVVQNRLIFAQTIAQSFQYAHIGSVDAGFCAYSSIFTDEGNRGRHLLIYHAPDIIQAACILKRTKIHNRAEAFAEFLISPEAERIKQTYGYR